MSKNIWTDTILMGHSVVASVSLCIALFKKWWGDDELFYCIHRVEKSLPCLSSSHSLGEEQHCDWQFPLLLFTIFLTL